MQRTKEEFKEGVTLKTTAYSHLFQPLRVNSVTLSNRVIAAPIDCHISKEKATGGASLIVLGDGFISERENTRLRKTSIYPYARDTIKQTKERLEFWRQGGARVSIELMHCGMYSNSGGLDWVYGVCEGERGDGVKIHEVTPEDMEAICEEYYQSAKAARELGFDMVTAHFAHGWLPSEFLSPTWNHRTDEYGGSYENRIRFPREILKAIRRAVGPAFPIDMRINGKDWIGPGQGIEEVARFLADMSAEHLVDMVNISAGADIVKEGNIHMATHAIDKRMTNIKLSRYVKEHVDIPVTVVGAVMTPENAEMIVRDGYADAVWLGRELFADPFWVKKAYEGRPEDIRPCVRCLYCFSSASDNQNFGCTVNPRVNKEDQYPRGKKTAHKKRVVVIGGGMGGMKAAITADACGHEVILLEKGDKVGGLVNFTDYVPSKQDLHDYKGYLKTQLAKSTVDVRLHTTASKELVESLNPDVIMVAVGSSPVTPPIPGITGENVTQALELFPKLEETEQKVAIIGGGTIGCELAIDLAETGREVTVIEMTGQLNALANHHYRCALSEKMKEYPNLKTLVHTRCTEVLPEGVRVMDESGKERIVEAQRVVVAAGMRANREMADSFFGITPYTYVIGDCSHVGKVKEATRDGFTYAYNLD